MPPPARGTCWKHKSGVELLILNTALKKSMRTHGYSPNPVLKKRAGLGIIAFVVQLCCCAEWGFHSYRAVGCYQHPTACRNYVSDNAILTDAGRNCKGFFRKYPPFC